MQPCAVLTGDIVASSDLTVGDLSRVLEALHAAVRDISGWGGDGMVTGFARRGGDGWQAVLAPPRYTFRAALFLRAATRRTASSPATRIALAEGPGQMPPATGAAPDPNYGHGPAFTDSGRLLETLAGRTEMAHAAGGSLDAAVRLADAISQGWTQAQARAVYEMLPPDAGPRAQAAGRLGISRSAVNQALWGASFPALEAAITLIEAAAP